MFKQILTHDFTLSLSAFAIAGAVVVKHIAHPNTVAYHIADWVIGAGASLGVYSTTSRESKE